MLDACRSSPSAGEAACVRGRASSCRRSPMSTTEEKGRQADALTGRSTCGRTSPMLATTMGVVTSQITMQNETAICEVTVFYLRAVEAIFMRGRGRSPKGPVISGGRIASAVVGRRAPATRRQSGSAVVAVSRML